MPFNVEGISERNIQEAIDDGLFDNLPGKGKPLDLSDTMPIHLRILKNAEALPDWIQTHKDQEAAQAEMNRIWQRLERDYPRRLAWAQSRVKAKSKADEARREFDRWLKEARDAFIRTMRQANDEILMLNMKAPSCYRSPLPIRMREETARFDAAFPGIELYSESSDSLGPEESALRNSARKLYGSIAPRRKSEQS